MEQEQLLLLTIEPEILEVVDFTCDRCNCEYLKGECGDNFIVDGHEMWCERCTNGYAFTCDRCNDICSGSSMTVEVGCWGRIAKKEWCESCVEHYAYSCEWCEDVLISNTDICESCEEHTFTCDDCGERRSVDDYARNGICDSCDTERESKYILNYDENVLYHLSFMGTPKLGDPFFGVELEVCTKKTDTDSAAEEVTRAFGHFSILKSDSSLKNGGFEIVTAPASLEMHKAEWTKFLNARARMSFANNLVSWNDAHCGMHVHVSRDKFEGEYHLAKFDRFFNCPTTKTLILAIAGRSSNQYAKIVDKKFSDCGKGNSRYTAVNLQNESTVEVRVFRGTLDLTHVLANIEFVHAVFRFTRLNEKKDFESSIAKFIRFVSNRPEIYFNLIQYLSKKEFTTDVPDNC